MSSVLITKYIEQKTLNRLTSEPVNETTVEAKWVAEFFFQRLPPYSRILVL